MNDLGYSLQFWIKLLHILLRFVFLGGGFVALCVSTKCQSSEGTLCVPSLLWHCWLGVRKSIWPIKNWMMRCWCGCLSGARCRLFAYGPAGATTIPKLLSSFASFKSRLVLPFWYRLTQVVLEKRPLNGCSSSYVALWLDITEALLTAFLIKFCASSDCLLTASWTVPLQVIQVTHWRLLNWTLLQWTMKYSAGTHTHHIYAPHKTLIGRFPALSSLSLSLSLPLSPLSFLSCVSTEGRSVFIGH